MPNREQALESIRANIAAKGFHIYLVKGIATPRFAYTIGLSEEIGHELTFAGGAVYDSATVSTIVSEIATRLRSGTRESQFSVDPLGAFSLGVVHQSWTEKLMIGALDYYQSQHVDSCQVVPDREHLTIDTPDLSRVRSNDVDGVWQWLDKDWDVPIPRKSISITNLNALRGEPVTELMRWEDEEWEMFAGCGTDVDESEMRIVPMCTMLGHDPTLWEITSLETGSGLWREDKSSVWQPWASQT